MKILTKSALLLGQPEARKGLGADGIEIIFLGGELELYDQTKDQLLRLADDFEVIGLEAPCQERELTINPISENPQPSRNYLSACVQLANEVHQLSKREVYFQFQYTFDNFDSQGKPSSQYRREDLIPRMRKFHQELQRQSDIEIQVENGTPIGTRSGGFAYQPVMTRCADIVATSVPLALDITHLAITFHTYAKTDAEKDDLYQIATPHGPFWIHLTKENQELRNRIRKSLSLQDAITSEVIAQIQKYASHIGSLQFSNAQLGFGTDDADEGYAGTDGLLDVPRIFKEAIIPANIPYVIPEYTEADYLNPVHQREAIEMVRRLMMLDQTREAVVAQEVSKLI